MQPTEHYTLGGFFLYLKTQFHLPVNLHSEWSGCFTVTGVRTLERPTNPLNHQSSRISVSSIQKVRRSEKREGERKIKLKKNLNG